MAAKTINIIEPEEQPFLYMNNSWSFQFYCKKQPIEINNDSLKNFKTKSLYAFAKEQDLAHLDSNGYKYSVIKSFDNFRVSMLTSGFLNKITREKYISKTMLIKIYTSDD